MIIYQNLNLSSVCKMKYQNMTNCKKKKPSSELYAYFHTEITKKKIVPKYKKNQTNTIQIEVWTDFLSEINTQT